MKQAIHPELKNAKVHCNGCGTEFESKSTVEKITVEICSNCHPFYTGKQKLVDVAGRVDRFKARQAAAGRNTKPKAAAAVTKSDTKTKDSTDKLEALKKQLAQAEPKPADQ